MIAFQIRFSEEWDKLRPDRRVIGHRFTTARKHTIPKFKYYSGCLHKNGSIILNSKKIGEAKLVGMQVSTAHARPREWWKRDTYSFYTQVDVDRLMTRFYGVPNPPLIQLELEWSEVVR